MVYIDSVNKTSNNILFVNLGMLVTDMIGVIWVKKKACGHNKNNKKKRETIQRGSRMETRSRVYTRQ